MSGPFGGRFLLVELRSEMLQVSTGARHRHELAVAVEDLLDLGFRVIGLWCPVDRQPAVPVERHPMCGLARVVGIGVVVGPNGGGVMDHVAPLRSACRARFSMSRQATPDRHIFAYALFSP